MRSKDDYTAAFIENDPREPHLRPKFDIAYWNWWQNARRDGGFRLTQKGCLHCIDRLELEFFVIVIVVLFLSTDVRKMDQVIPAVRALKLLAN